MKTEMIEEWVSNMSKICADNFGDAYANVTVHFIAEKWVARIDKPKVYVTHENVTTALAVARSEVDELINKQASLARTLGLEAAE